MPDGSDLHISRLTWGLEQIAQFLEAAREGECTAHSSTDHSAEEITPADLMRIDL